MDIGFTATRKGLTIEQMDALRSFLLGRADDISLHHSDRLGGEYQGHVLARELHIQVVAHPTARPEHRAWSFSDRENCPKDKWYGKELVDSVDLLVAAPSSPQPRPLSWTWSTIRYANLSGKDVVMIYPDGRTEIKDHHHDV